MQANIITRNPEKMLTAKNVFDRYEIATNFIDKDYIEIQADTNLEIARYTAKTAARELQMAVIREDHSYCSELLCQTYQVLFLAIKPSFFVILARIPCPFSNIAIFTLLGNRQFKGSLRDDKMLVLSQEKKFYIS